MNSQEYGLTRRSHENRGGGRRDPKKESAKARQRKCRAKKKQRAKKMDLRGEKRFFPWLFLKRLSPWPIVRSTPSPAKKNNMYCAAQWSVLPSFPLRGWLWFHNTPGEVFYSLEGGGILFKKNDVTWGPWVLWGECFLVSPPPKRPRNAWNWLAK